MGGEAASLGASVVAARVLCLLCLCANPEAKDASGHAHPIATPQKAHLQLTCSLFLQGVRCVLVLSSPSARMSYCGRGRGSSREEQREAGRGSSREEQREAGRGSLYCIAALACGRWPEG